MKNLTNEQSRRMVLFIETQEEKKIARKLLLNCPLLFIWAEDEDFLSLEIELNSIIEDDSTKVLFLRRGCNYTASDGGDLEILR